MNEAAAREVLMLQAFETVQPPSPNWSEEDRAWATRLARQEAPAQEVEGFIVRRARHAMQRLAPRESAAAKWLARRWWRARWIAWAMLAGFVFGVLADSIGSGQRINLLAPPQWAVVVWNLVVFGLLLGHALAHLLMRPTRPTRPGGLVRLTQRLLRGAAGAAAGGSAAGPSVTSSGTSSGTSSDGTSARALHSFAHLWLRASAALSAARVATLLHAAAAALALGLIAGLYLRGLVLDYRAAWESTFLSADAAHALLAVALGPAAALSGIALPDATAFEAMRVAHGSAVTGAPAAPWIHLMALTLLLFVVLPRCVLALVGVMRQHWLARHVALPLGDPYFQQLARQQQGDAARVVVVPYASAPGAQAAPGLRAVLAPVLGGGVQVQFAATLAFGAEDDAGEHAALPAGTALVVALFDLAATPEAESQGRFAQRLAGRAPNGAATILLIDEASFRRRFGVDSQRIGQRRAAWRRFAEAFGTEPVFVDLEAPDPGAASGALQLAMRSPVREASA